MMHELPVEATPCARPNLLRPEEPLCTPQNLEAWRESLGRRPFDESQELERRVKLFLCGCHLPGVRRVAIDADRGVVRLHGKVRSFYERQMAVQLVSRVAGVVRVVDAIEVALAPSFTRGLAAESA